MSECVKDESALVNEKVVPRFIKPSTFRAMLGNISRMTEWRLRQSDPDFSTPHERFGYVQSEAEAYLIEMVVHLPMRIKAWHF
jgi:hypothetical protein